MKLTIFTPCYNRAHCLPRLYESLLKQTSYNFEWLIIDDGSSDNTQKVVEEFSKCEKFEIRYVFKDNGGKHTAHNKALEEARGEFFFCVDSDDWLMEDAVCKIIESTTTIQNSAGILAYKCDSQNKLLSSAFPESILYSSINGLRQNYGWGGELSIVLKTDIARKYPYPVFKNEKFLGECVVYDRIDKNYTYILLPFALTICEYQADGYTASVDKLLKANPTGYCLYYMQRIDIVQGLKNRLIIAGKYHAFRIFSCKAIHYNGNHQFITALAAPLGRLYWLYYKLFRGF